MTSKVRLEWTKLLCEKVIPSGGALLEIGMDIGFNLWQDGRVYTKNRVMADFVKHS